MPAVEHVQHGGVGEEGVGDEVGDTERPGRPLETHEETRPEAFALMVAGVLRALVRGRVEAR